MYLSHFFVFFGFFWVGSSFLVPVRRRKLRRLPCHNSMSPVPLLQAQPASTPARLRRAEAKATGDGEVLRKRCDIVFFHFLCICICIICNLWLNHESWLFDVLDDVDLMILMLMWIMSYYSCMFCWLLHLISCHAGVQEASSGWWGRPSSGEAETTVEQSSDWAFEGAFSCGGKKGANSRFFFFF